MEENGIDFDDVYGGPPTWTRYSYSGSRMQPWEETTCLPTDRPVFGDSYIYSSPSNYDDDFFRDVFTSADYSSPAKMTNPSRSSCTAKKILRSNSAQTPGQSLLSREASSVKKSVYSTQSAESETGHESKPSAGFKSIEFHFSIYKWANTGVPLLMSTLKGSSKVNALSIDSLQDSGLQNEDLSADKKDSGISLKEVIESERLSMEQEVNMHQVIPPSSLLHDEVERKGYEEAVTEAGTKEKMGTMNGKAKKMNYSNKAGSNKPGFRSAKNRVKGMVKDFFKMSNQESGPKRKTDDSFIWKTRSRKRIQEEVDDIISSFDRNVVIKTDASETTKLASELRAESVKMAPNASITMSFMRNPLFMANEETQRSNRQKFSQNRTIRKLEDINFPKYASSASEFIPNGSKASVETVEDPSLDDFQVEELGHVQDKLPKTQEESEAIMALDSKIHMWSSGRTGNIRSLLSTLQLVLWAESGWKPVGLVDILEENALKKVYNRAMLCLHPDKLQQKGADKHIKYIAEKVFHILQEAWEHFNSLGGVIR